jgi:CDP-diacylglycerol--glycerol-3-phosphate 3-phosphatidyltransferase
MTSHADQTGRHTDEPSRQAPSPEVGRVPARRARSFTGAIGIFFATLRDLLARGLVPLGVTPNALTALGCGLSAAAGLAFALGPPWQRWPAVAFLVGAGACDMLDGAVAKLGGRATAFGAFLDSTLDRASDGFLFGGLFWYWAARGEALLAGLSLSALLAAFLVSYTRARAENLIDSCKVGFWERGERTVLLLIGATFAVLPAAVLVLGTLVHLTALQRVLHTRRVLEDRVSEPPAGRLARLGWWLVHRVLFWAYPRASLPYDVVVAATIAFVLWVRFPG